MEYLTEKDFKERIFDYDTEKEWNYKGDKPVIVDFGADWCQPCKIIEPILEELSEDYKDEISIYKVNVDDEHELSAALGIKSIPSILFVPVDKEPEMAIGALPKESFNLAIKELFKITK